MVLVGGGWMKMEMKWCADVLKVGPGRWIVLGVRGSFTSP
jgi:hypothetical protein